MDEPAVDLDSLVPFGSTVRQLMGVQHLTRSGVQKYWPILAVVTILSLALMPISMVLRLCVDPPKEFEEITLCCLLTSICFGFMLKSVDLISNGATCHQLLLILSQTRKEHVNEQGVDIRRRYRRLAQRLYVSYQVMSAAASTGWICGPMLSRALRKDSASETSRQLPVPVWLPTDVNASPVYEILFAMETYCAVITAEATTCADIFYVQLLLLLAAEIEILTNNITNMGLDSKRIGQFKDENGSTALKRSDKVHKLRGEPPVGDKEGDQLYSEFVHNIQHHQKILECVSLAQSIMNVSVFSVVFFNMANLCSSMFIVAVLLQRDGHVGNALNALCSIPPHFFQIVVYCIFSQMMTDQSEKLMYAAFSCGWTECNARFKRSMLIFMSSTVEPMVITVGKTCKLSKELLIQVVNGTYALLNMLYYMQSRTKE